jgi:hypothetical protein
MSSSHNNKIYALGLSRHIEMQPGKRINAGKDWPQYFSQNGIDKGGLKPKALCDEFPDILQWTTDTDAPGNGWISCAQASVSAVAASNFHQDDGRDDDDNDYEGEDFDDAYEELQETYAAADASRKPKGKGKPPPPIRGSGAGCHEPRHSVGYYKKKGLNCFP